MNTEELNKAIRDLDDRDDLPSVQKQERFSASSVGNISITASRGSGTLESILDLDKDTGKKIFYWGWFWRSVDFDQQISLAWDEEGATGFCENNKWGYPMVTLSKEQSKELRELCELAVVAPSAEKILAVNTFMNNCKPADWRHEATAAREEMDEVMRKYQE